MDEEKVKVDGVAVVADETTATNETIANSVVESPAEDGVGDAGSVLPVDAEPADAAHDFKIVEDGLPPAAPLPLVRPPLRPGVQAGLRPGMPG